MAKADDDDSGKIEFQEFRKLIGAAGKKDVEQVMEETWALLDERKRGRIGISELKSLIRRCGLTLPMREFEAMMLVGDGIEISYGSFCGAFDSPAFHSISRLNKLIKEQHLLSKIHEIIN